MSLHPQAYHTQTNVRPQVYRGQGSLDPKVYGAKNSLYITFQYLRTVNGQNKYHWGLWATGERPPQGVMYHATDKNRSALDLYYETKEVSDPTKSHTMIVCLKVADISYLEVIDRYVRAVPLMNPYKIPRGEPVWTCRVWVKEALKNLHAARVIRLPASLEKIEKCGIYTADKVVPYRRPNKGQRPRLEKPSMYNDLDWLSQNISPTVPMDIDSVQDHPVQERYYGPKPMITDMTTQAPKRPYYGAKPMITDSNHQSTVQPNHYGTTPMMIDSTDYYTSSSRRAY